MSGRFRSAASAPRISPAGSARAPPASASAPRFFVPTTLSQRSSSAPGNWCKPYKKHIVSSTGDSGADGIINQEAFVKPLDIAIIAVYAVSIFALAQWVSREKGAD